MKKNMVFTLKNEKNYKKFLILIINFKLLDSYLSN